MQGNTFYMRLALLVLLQLVIVAPLYGQTEGEWKQIDHYDDITVYSKEVPGNALLAFKGTTTVDYSAPKVITVLKDINRRKEWMPDVLEATIIHDFPCLEQIEYSRIDAPWPCKDRDFVIHGKTTYTVTNNRIHVQMRSVADSKALERDDAVRAEIFASSYVIESLEQRTRTRLTVEIHMDPKGWIPSWIANWAQKDWPKEFLEGFRVQIQKDDIVPDRETVGFFEDDCH